MMDTSRAFATYDADLERGNPAAQDVPEQCPVCGADYADAASGDALPGAVDVYCSTRCQAVDRARLAAQDEALYQEWLQDQRRAP